MQIPEIIIFSSTLQYLQRPMFLWSMRINFWFQLKQLNIFIF